MCNYINQQNDMMFSSIKQQLGAYKSTRQHCVQSSPAKQLPPPNYSFTPLIATSRTSSNSKFPCSPQRMNMPLPVRFDKPAAQPGIAPPPIPTVAISFAPRPIPPQSQFPTQMSFGSANTQPPPLIRSRSSNRKHNIFSDKIYTSGVRSLSRKRMDVPIQSERVRFDSRLFNQSIGSNRFYNHTEEKANQNRKMRFPTSPRKVEYERERMKESELASSVDSLNESSINKLEKLSSKEVESRIVGQKVQAASSPSNKTDKNLKPPKSFKKLESKDFNDLAATSELRQVNRFFDSQKSSFGQRQLSKQKVYFSKEINEAKPLMQNNALQNSLEEMIAKLDARSKIIACLVILMVISLVIYQIVR